MSVHNFVPNELAGRHVPPRTSRLAVSTFRMVNDNPISPFRDFAAAKCLTVLNLATSRIKATRNRKWRSTRQVRGDIAELLQSGQAANVYHTKIVALIKEENMLAAYDLIDGYCHQIINKFAIIDRQRYCPPELREPVASLIYAATRCAELPELTEIKNMLTSKFRDAFVTAAVEAEPDCGVSRDIIVLFSTHPPTKQSIIKLMMDICMQNKIAWQLQWAPDEASITHSNLDNLSKREEERAHIQTANGIINQSVHKLSSGHLSSPRKQASKDNVRITQGKGNQPNLATGSEFKNEDSQLKSGTSIYNPNDSFHVNEPAARGYDLKQYSCLQNESTRSKASKSDSIHSPQPYGPAFNPTLGGKFARDYKNLSDGQQQTHTAGHNVKHSSFYKHEPELGESNGASYCRPEMVDCTTKTHHKKAENVMQSPDEISDSGSDIFVSYDDDDGAQPHHSDRITANSYLWKSSDQVQGTREDKLTNKGIRIQPITETGLNAEGIKRFNTKKGKVKNSPETNHSSDHMMKANCWGQNVVPGKLQHDEEPAIPDKRENSCYSNQERGDMVRRSSWERPCNFGGSSEAASNVPWLEKIVKETPESPDLAESLLEDNFASTAKAIATEAARLAVLSYAKQHSRLRSSLMINKENDIFDQREGCVAADDVNNDCDKKCNSYVFDESSRKMRNEACNADAELFTVMNNNPERPTEGVQTYRGRSKICTANLCKRPDVAGDHEETQSLANQEIFKENPMPSSLEYNHYHPQQRNNHGKQDTWSARGELSQSKVSRSFAAHHHEEEHVSADVDHMHKSYSARPEGRGQGRSKLHGMEQTVQTNLTSGAPHVLDDPTRAKVSPTQVNKPPIREIFMGNPMPSSLQCNHYQPQQRNNQGKQETWSAEGELSQSKVSRSFAAHRHEEEHISADVDHMHKSYSARPEEREQGRSKLHGMEQTIQTNLTSGTPHVLDDPRRAQVSPIQVNKPPTREIFKENPMPSSLQYNHYQPQPRNSQGKQETRSAEGELSQSKVSRSFAAHHHKEEDISADVNHMHKSYSARPEERRSKLHGIERTVQTNLTSGTPHVLDDPRRAHMSAIQVNKPPTRDPPTVPQKNHHKPGELNTGHMRSNQSSQRPSRNPPAVTQRNQHELISRQLSSNYLSQPPSRKPPPLHQRHRSEGEQHNPQPFMYEKQVNRAQETVGSQLNNDVMKIDRRERPSLQPRIVRAGEREQVQKGTTPMPQEFRSSSSPFSSPASSDVQNASPPTVAKENSPAQASLLSPTNVRNKTKFPHVDEIAANLAALHRARYAQ